MSSSPPWWRAKKGGGSSKSASSSSSTDSTSLAYSRGTIWRTTDLEFIPEELNRDPLELDDNSKHNSSWGDERRSTSTSATKRGLFPLNRTSEQHFVELSRENPSRSPSSSSSASVVSVVDLQASRSVKFHTEGEKDNGEYLCDAAEERSPPFYKESVINFIDNSKTEGDGEREMKNMCGTTTDDDTVKDLLVDIDNQKSIIKGAASPETSGSSSSNDVGVAHVSHSSTNSSASSTRSELNFGGSFSTPSLLHSSASLISHGTNSSGSSTGVRTNSDDERSDGEEEVEEGGLIKRRTKRETDNNDTENTTNNLQKGKDAALFVGESEAGGQKEEGRHPSFSTRVSHHFDPEEDRAEVSSIATDNSDHDDDEHHDAFMGESCGKSPHLNLSISKRKANDDVVCAALTTTVDGISDNNDNVGHLCVGGDAVYTSLVQRDPHQAESQGDDQVTANDNTGGKGNREGGGGSAAEAADSADKKENTSGAALNEDSDLLATEKEKEEGNLNIGPLEKKNIISSNPTVYPTSGSVSQPEAPPNDPSKTHCRANEDDSTDGGGRTATKATTAVDAASGPHKLISPKRDSALPIQEGRGGERRGSNKSHDEDNKNQERNTAVSATSKTIPASRKAILSPSSLSSIFHKVSANTKDSVVRLRTVFSALTKRYEYMAETERLAGVGPQSRHTKYCYAKSRLGVGKCIPMSANGRIEYLPPLGYFGHDHHHCRRSGRDELGKLRESLFREKKIGESLSGAFGEGAENAQKNGGGSEGRKSGKIINNNKSTATSASSFLPAQRNMSAMAIDLYFSYYTERYNAVINRTILNPKTCHTDRCKRSRIDGVLAPDGGLRTIQEKLAKLNRQNHHNSRTQIKTQQRGGLSDDGNNANRRPDCHHSSATVPAAPCVVFDSEGNFREVEFDSRDGPYKNVSIEQKARLYYDLEYLRQAASTTGEDQQQQYDNDNRTIKNSRRATAERAASAERRSKPKVTKSANLTEKVRSSSSRMLSRIKQCGNNNISPTQTQPFLSSPSSTSLSPSSPFIPSQSIFAAAAANSTQTCPLSILDLALSPEDSPSSSSSNTASLVILGCLGNHFPNPYPRFEMGINDLYIPCPLYADYNDLCANCKQMCDLSGCTCRFERHCDDCTQFSWERRKSEHCCSIYEDDVSRVVCATSGGSRNSATTCNTTADGVDGYFDNAEETSADIDSAAPELATLITSNFHAKSMQSEQSYEKHKMIDLFSACKKFIVFATEYDEVARMSNHFTAQHEAAVAAYDKHVANVESRTPQPPIRPPSSRVNRLQIHVPHSSRTTNEVEHVSDVLAVENDKKTATGVASVNTEEQQQPAGDFLLFSIAEIKEAVREKAQLKHAVKFSSRALRKVSKRLRELEHAEEGGLLIKTLSEESIAVCALINKKKERHGGVGYPNGMLTIYSGCEIILSLLHNDEHDYDDFGITTSCTKKDPITLERNDNDGVGSPSKGNQPWLPRDNTYGTIYRSGQRLFSAVFQKWVGQNSSVSLLSSANSPLPMASVTAPNPHHLHEDGSSSFDEILTLGRKNVDKKKNNNDEKRCQGNLGEQRQKETTTTTTHFVVPSYNIISLPAEKYLALGASNGSRTIVTASASAAATEESVSLSVNPKIIIHQEMGTFAKASSVVEIGEKRGEKKIESIQIKSKDTASGQNPTKTEKNLSIFSPLSASSTYSSDQEMRFATHQRVLHLAEVCKELVHEIQEEKKGIAVRCREIVKIPTVSYETILTFSMDTSYFIQLCLTSICAVLVLGFVAASRTNTSISFGTALIDEVVVTDQFRPTFYSSKRFMTNTTPYTNKGNNRDGREIGYFYRMTVDEASGEQAWYDFLELTLIPALTDWSVNTSASSVGDANSSHSFMTQDLLLGEFIPLTSLELSAIHVEPHSDECLGAGRESDHITFKNFLNWGSGSSSSYSSSPLRGDESSGLPSMCYGPYREGRVERRPNFRSKFNIAEYNTSKKNTCGGFFFSGHINWFYGCDRYAVNIPYSTTLEEAGAIMDMIRSYRFGYAPSARLLAAKTYLYHVELAVVYELTIAFEISPTGGSLVHKSIFPIPLERVTTVGFVAGIVALLCICSFSITWIWNFRNVYPVVSFAVLFRPSEVLQMIVELLCIVSHATLCVYCFVFIETNSAELRETLSRFVAGANSTGAKEHFYNSVNILNSTDPDLAIRLQTMGHYEQGYKILCVVCIIAIIVRLIPFTSIMTTIHKVTLTISNVAFRTISLLIIFVAVIAGFSMAGVILFGENSADFRNFGETMGLLFGMLVGDVNYNSMKASGSPAALLFVLMYLLVGTCVFLNFIIAILTNSLYDTVLPPHVSFSEWVWIKINHAVDFLVACRREGVLETIIHIVFSPRANCFYGMRRFEDLRVRRHQQRLQKRARRLRLENELSKLFTVYKYKFSKYSSRRRQSEATQHHPCVNDTDNKNTIKSSDNRLSTADWRDLQSFSGHGNDGSSRAPPHQEQQTDSNSMTGSGDPFFVFPSSSRTLNAPDECEDMTNVSRETTARGGATSATHIITNQQQRRGTNAPYGAETDTCIKRDKTKENYDRGDSHKFLLFPESKFYFIFQNSSVVFLDTNQGQDNDTEKAEDHETTTAPNLLGESDCDDEGLASLGAPTKGKGEDRLTFREITAWARYNEDPRKEIDPSLISPLALLSLKGQWLYLCLMQKRMERQLERKATKSMATASSSAALSSSHRNYFNAASGSSGSGGGKSSSSASAFDTVALTSHFYTPTFDSEESAAAAGGASSSIYGLYFSKTASFLKAMLIGDDDQAKKGKRKINQNHRKQALSDYSPTFSPSEARRWHRQTINTRLPPRDGKSKNDCCEELDSSDNGGDEEDVNKPLILSSTEPANMGEGSICIRRLSNDRYSDDGLNNKSHFLKLAARRSAFGGSGSGSGSCSNSTTPGIGPRLWPQTPPKHIKDQYGSVLGGGTNRDNYLLNEDIIGSNVKAGGRPFLTPQQQPKTFNSNATLRQRQHGQFVRRSSVEEKEEEEEERAFLFDQQNTMLLRKLATPQILGRRFERQLSSFSSKSNHLLPSASPLPFLFATSHSGENDMNDTINASPRPFEAIDLTIALSTVNSRVPLPLRLNDTGDRIDRVEEENNEKDTVGMNKVKKRKSSSHRTNDAASTVAAARRPSTKRPFPLAADNFAPVDDGEISKLKRAIGGGRRVGGLNMSSSLFTDAASLANLVSIIIPNFNPQNPQRLTHQYARSKLRMRDPRAKETYDYSLPFSLIFEIANPFLDVFLETVKLSAYLLKGIHGVDHGSSPRRRRRSYTFLMNNDENHDDDDDLGFSSTAKTINDSSPRGGFFRVSSFATNRLGGASSLHKPPLAPSPQKRCDSSMIMSNTPTRGGMEKRRKGQFNPFRTAVDQSRRGSRLGSERMRRNSENGVGEDQDQDQEKAKGRRMSVITFDDLPQQEEGKEESTPHATKSGRLAVSGARRSSAVHVVAEGKDSFFNFDFRFGSERPSSAAAAAAAAAAAENPKKLKIRRGAQGKEKEIVDESDVDAGYCEDESDTNTSSATPNKNRERKQRQRRSVQGMELLTRRSDRRQEGNESESENEDGGGSLVFMPLCNQRLVPALFSSNLGSKSDQKENVDHDDDEEKSSDTSSYIFESDDASEDALAATRNSSAGVLLSKMKTNKIPEIVFNAYPPFSFSSTSANRIFAGPPAGIVSPSYLTKIQGKRDESNNGESGNEKDGDHIDLFDDDNLSINERDDMKWYIPSFSLRKGTQLPPPLPITPWQPILGPRGSQFSTSFSLPRIRFLDDREKGDDMMSNSKRNNNYGLSSYPQHQQQQQRQRLSRLSASSYQPTLTGLLNLTNGGSIRNSIFTDKPLAKYGRRKSDSIEFPSIVDGSQQHLPSIPMSAPPDIDFILFNYRQMQLAVESLYLEYLHDRDGKHLQGLSISNDDNGSSTNTNFYTWADADFGMFERQRNAEELKRRISQATTALSDSDFLLLFFIFSKLAEELNPQADEENTDDSHSHPSNRTASQLSSSSTGHFGQLKKGLRKVVKSLRTQINNTTNAGEGRKASFEDEEELNSIEAVDEANETYNNNNNNKLLLLPSSSDLVMNVYDEEENEEIEEEEEINKDPPTTIDRDAFTKLLLSLGDKYPNPLENIYSALFLLFCGPGAGGRLLRRKSAPQTQLTCANERRASSREGGAGVSASLPATPGIGFDEFAIAFYCLYHEHVNVRGDLRPSAVVQEEPLLISSFNAASGERITPSSGFTKFLHRQSIIAPNASSAPSAALLVSSNNNSGVGSGDNNIGGTLIHQFVPLCEPLGNPFSSIMGVFVRAKKPNTPYIDDLCRLRMRTSYEKQDLDIIYFRSYICFVKIGRETQMRHHHFASVLLDYAQIDAKRCLAKFEKRESVVSSEIVDGKKGKRRSGSFLMSNKKESRASGKPNDEENKRNRGSSRRRSATADKNSGSNKKTAASSPLDARRKKELEKNLKIEIHFRGTAARHLIAHMQSEILSENNYSSSSRPPARRSSDLPNLSSSPRKSTASLFTMENKTSNKNEGNKKRTPLLSRGIAPSPQPLTSHRLILVEPRETILLRLPLAKAFKFDDYVTKLAVYWERYASFLSTYEPLDFSGCGTQTPPRSTRSKHPDENDGPVANGMEEEQQKAATATTFTAKYNPYLVVFPPSVSEAFAVIEREYWAQRGVRHSHAQDNENVDEEADDDQEGGGFEEDAMAILGLVDNNTKAKNNKNKSEGEKKKKKRRPPRIDCLPSSLIRKQPRDLQPPGAILGTRLMEELRLQLSSANGNMVGTKSGVSKASFDGLFDPFSFSALEAYNFVSVYTTISELIASSKSNASLRFSSPSLRRSSMNTASSQDQIRIDASPRKRKPSEEGSTNAVLLSNTGETKVDESNPTSTAGEKGTAPLQPSSVSSIQDPINCYLSVKLEPLRKVLVIPLLLSSTTKSSAAASAAMCIDLMARAEFASFCIMQRFFDDRPIHSDAKKKGESEESFSLAQFILSVTQFSIMQQRKQSMTDFSREAPSENGRVSGATTLPKKTQQQFVLVRNPSPTRRIDDQRVDISDSKHCSTLTVVGICGDPIGESLRKEIMTFAPALAQFVGKSSLNQFSSSSVRRRSSIALSPPKQTSKKNSGGAKRNSVSSNTCNHQASPTSVLSPPSSFNSAANEVINTLFCIFKSFPSKSSITYANNLVDVDALFNCVMGCRALFLLEHEVQTEEEEEGGREAKSNKRLSSSANNRSPLRHIDKMKTPATTAVYASPSRILNMIKNDMFDTIGIHPLVREEDYSCRHITVNGRQKNNILLMKQQDQQRQREQSPLCLGIGSEVLVKKEEEVTSSSFSHHQLPAVVLRVDLAYLIAASRISCDREDIVDREVTTTHPEGHLGVDDEMLTFKDFASFYPARHALVQLYDLYQSLATIEKKRVNRADGSLRLKGDDYATVMEIDRESFCLSQFQFSAFLHSSPSSDSPPSPSPRARAPPPPPRREKEGEVVEAFSFPPSSVGGQHSPTKGMIRAPRMMKKVPPKTDNDDVDDNNNNNNNSSSSSSSDEMPPQRNNNGSGVVDNNCVGDGGERLPASVASRCRKGVVRGNFGAVALHLKNIFLTAEDREWKGNNDDFLQASSSSCNMYMYESKPPAMTTAKAVSPTISFYEFVAVLMSYWGPFGSLLFDWNGIELLPPASPSPLTFASGRSSSPHLNNESSNDVADNRSNDVNGNISSKLREAFLLCDSIMRSLGTQMVGREILAAIDRLSGTPPTHHIENDDGQNNDIDNSTNNKASPRHVFGPDAVLSLLLIHTRLIKHIEKRENNKRNCQQLSSKDKNADSATLKIVFIDTTPSSRLQSLESEEESDNNNDCGEKTSARGASSVPVERQQANSVQPDSAKRKEEDEEEICNAIVTDLLKCVHHDDGGLDISTSSSTLEKRVELLTFASFATMIIRRYLLSVDNDDDHGDNTRFLNRKEQQNSKRPSQSSALFLRRSRVRTSSLCPLITSQGLLHDSSGPCDLAEISPPFSEFISLICICKKRASYLSGVLAMRRGDGDNDEKSNQTKHKSTNFSLGPETQNDENKNTCPSAAGTGTLKRRSLAHSTDLEATVREGGSFTNTDEALALIFAVFDVDGDGNISVSDLRQFPSLTSTAALYFGLGGCTSSTVDASIGKDSEEQRINLVTHQDENKGEEQTTVTAVCATAFSSGLHGAQESSAAPSCWLSSLSGLVLTEVNVAIFSTKDEFIRAIVEEYGSAESSVEKSEKEESDELCISLQDFIRRPFSFPLIIC